MNEMHETNLKSSPVATWHAAIYVHDLEAVESRIIADSDEPQVLLGRDVWNRFRLLLDGPAMALEIDGPH